MDEEIDAELKELFTSASDSKVGLEDDVLAELKSIMRMHSIPPQELFYKWESYSMKMGTDMRLGIETVVALKKDVQDGLERESRSKAHVLNANRRGGATPRNISSNNDMFDVLGGLTNTNTPRTGSSAKFKRKGNPDTPSVSRIKGEPASSPPNFKTPERAGLQSGLGNPTSFNDRKNAGQLVEVLNGHLKIAEPPIAPYPESRIKLTAYSDMKKLSYKTMAMKASEASEILDDRIDDFMLLIQEHHKLEDSELGSAASQSTSEIVAVGRIASDSAEGKLNASSLVLETSRRMGAGLRIPLKVDQLQGFQFFPGQIVALKGINASGDNFAVSEVLEAPLLKSAASAPAAYDEHLRRLGGGPDAMDMDSTPAPLNVLIGAGPFTADDNLDFEPLHAICSQAADSYADVLILTGPFLDLDHPLIAAGDFDLPDDTTAEPDTATMSTVFKHLVSPAFNQLVSLNPRITILLIPSVKDTINKHACWPQEPIARKELGLPKAVRVVGNPMSIGMNELNIGITSQDILSELRLEEVLGGRPTDETMLERLPKYMIQQRHFFPLYPPVDRTKLPKTGTDVGVPTGAMLDVSYLKLGEILNVKPDLLIVPSALPPFAKVVESVVAVNPGYLSKRRGPGTFARLTIYPPSLTEEERAQNVMLPHKLFDRVRIDIVRI